MSKGVDLYDNVYGDYESRCRVASAGFDHHILKPIDLDTLRSLLAAPDGRAR